MQALLGTIWASANQTNSLQALGHLKPVENITMMLLSLSSLSPWLTLVPW